MQRTILISFLLLYLPFSAYAADGLINVESQFDVQTTADRLENIFHKKGVTVFNRIKHSESAAKIAIKLLESELIIFGNPKLGSPLMKCQPTVAIDLPQKILIWQDKNNKVWLSYNDIRYLEKRHHIQGCEKTISEIERVFSKVTHAAAHK